MQQVLNLKERYYNLLNFKNFIFFGKTGNKKNPAQWDFKIFSQGFSDGIIGFSLARRFFYTNFKLCFVDFFNLFFFCQRFCQNKDFHNLKLSECRELNPGRTHPKGEYCRCTTLRNNPRTLSLFLFCQSFDAFGASENPLARS